MAITTFNYVVAVHRDGRPVRQSRVSYYSPYVGQPYNPYYARPYDPYYARPYGPYAPYPYAPYPQYYYGSGNPFVDAFAGIGAAIGSAVRD